MENADTRSLSRRNLMVGVAAATATATLPSPTRAATATSAVSAAIANFKAAYRAVEIASALVDHSPLYTAVESAERAVLAAPITSPEDIALKLEYALENDVCGDAFGASFEGLDLAMFQGMIDALRGPLAGTLA